MNFFSEKSRKWLRNFYRVLGVTAISLVFQACYGMPMDNYFGPEDGPPETEKEAEEEDDTDI